MDNFLFATLIIGILVISILIVFSVRVQKNNWYLAGCLICLSYSLVATWLISSGVLLKVPFLIRVGNIFGYLVYPLLYLFAYKTFYPGRFWHKTDLLFFIPGLLYIVDMTPFFLLPASEKIATLQQNLEGLREIHRKREGWIFPTGFHVVFRSLWAFAIHLMLLWLVFINRKLTRSARSSGNKSVFRFILMLAILFIPLTLILILGTITQAPWWDINVFSFILSCPLFGAAIFLLFSPGVLYGFRPLVFKRLSMEEPVADMPEKVLSTLETTHAPEFPLISQMDTERLNIYANQLKTFMEKNHPYNEQGLTIHKLSEYSGIPVYIISLIVNNKEKSNFVSWLNKYRIRQFLTLCNSSDLRNFTMEALALKSGFSNRITFTNAFKREMGESPGRYLKSKLNLSEK